MRLPLSVSLLCLAAWAAAAPPSPPYHALDSGALVPVPKGYRAASRPRPEDPDSETVALFTRGTAAEALESDEPKNGRIIVEATALTERERRDPEFPKRLEDGLRRKAKSRAGKAACAWMKDAPRKALSCRQSDPDRVDIYLFAPKRLVKVSAEHWSTAIAEIVKGYRDGP